MLSVDALLLARDISDIAFYGDCPINWDVDRVDWEASQRSQINEAFTNFITSLQKLDHWPYRSNRDVLIGQARRMRSNCLRLITILSTPQRWGRHKDEWSEDDRALLLELNTYVKKLGEFEDEIIAAETPPSRSESADSPPLAERTGEGAPDARDREAAPFVLARDGRMWFVRAFGREGLFPDLTGFKLLDKLLRSPGVPLPMIELLRDDDTLPLVRHSVNNDDHLAEKVADAGLSTGAAKPEPVLDRQAEAEIKREIARLQREIEEADNDVDRRDSQCRLDKLRAYYQKMKGFNGKARPLGDSTDKLRARIFKLIKTVCDNLRASGMDQLADHFRSPIIRATAKASYTYFQPPGISWVFKKNRQ